jgi:putative oxidoreductase
MMKYSRQSLILRIAVAVILVMHSVPGMLNDGVNNFGNLYLNKIGFAPFGLFLAWLIKTSHVAAAISLLLNKFVIPLSIITIAILITGIILVHYRNGWFVVGGGVNGIEYNFLLISVFCYFIVEQFKKKNS